MFRIAKIIKTLHDNFFAEQSRWIASVPFLFALGIALYFSLPTEPNIWLALGIFEVWLLAFYLLRHKGLHLFFISGIIGLKRYIQKNSPIFRGKLQIFYQTKRVNKGLFYRLFRTTKHLSKEIFALRLIRKRHRYKLTNALK